MLEDGRIDWKQLAWLILISRFVTFVSLEALKSPPANQQTWLVGPIALIITLIIVIPILILAKRFPQHTIIQYSKILLGPIGGKLVGMLLIWFFIQISAMTFRLLGDFFTTTVMPQTPSIVLIIGLALLTAPAVRSGLEVTGRMGEIIGPVVLLTITIVIVLVAKELDPKRLLPLSDKGFSQIFLGGFLYALRCTEILVIAMAFPYLNRKQDVKKAIFLNFATYFFLYVVIDAAVLCLFGVEKAKRLPFPLFELTRMIRVGQFLERIEAAYLSIWFLSIFIKELVFYYCAVLAIAQMLRLQDYKPLVLPVGTLAVSLSIFLFDNYVEAKEFSAYKIWSPYSSIFLVFLPLTLLVTELIRKNGGQQR